MDVLLVLDGIDDVVCDNKCITITKGDKVISYYFCNKDYNKGTFVRIVDAINDQCRITKSIVISPVERRHIEVI